MYRRVHQWRDGVRVGFSERQREVIAYHAEQYNQRRTKFDRELSLQEHKRNHLVGQFGEAALATVVARGFRDYNCRRLWFNDHPHESDGGRDLWPPFMIDVDVKGHHLKKHWQERRDYYVNRFYMHVLAADYRPNWTYVYALVPWPNPTYCHVLGWAWAEEFTFEGDPYWFENNWAVRLNQLHCMRDFPWHVQADGKVLKRDDRR